MARGDADEKLFEAWLKQDHWTVHRARKAASGMFVDSRTGATRARTFAHDLFGALDLLAFNKDGDVWGVQVTTENGVCERKKKVSEVDWPYYWRISIAVRTKHRDPADRRRWKHYWRTYDHDTCFDGDWSVPEAVQFDLAALKKGGGK